jgi:hypothetical protein
MPAEGAARPAPDRDRIDRAIEHASWLGALAMFAYGAALSFDVPHSIALAAGFTQSWPGCGRSALRPFRAVAAVAVLAEQRTRPHKTPWYFPTSCRLVVGRWRVRIPARLSTLPGL